MTTINPTPYRNSTLPLQCPFAPSSPLPHPRLTPASSSTEGRRAADRRGTHATPEGPLSEPRPTNAENNYMNHRTTLLPHSATAATRTMKQRRLTKHLAVLALAAIAALACNHATAQSRYVLTDGSTRLVANITSANPEDIMYIDSVGYRCTSKCDDPVNRHVESTPKLWSTSSASDTTIYNVIGTHFLTLDTVHHAGDEANIYRLKDTNAFTPLGVWSRTASRGYYFQEVNGSFYYLCMTSSKGPFVLRLEKDDAVSGPSYWNDWDFGAAIEEVYTRDGRKDKEYYWLMWNGSEWTTSCNSYNRPETIIYLSDDDETDKTYYCVDPASVGSATLRPSGHAAQTATVGQTYIERAIVESSIPSDKGFTGITAEGGITTLSLKSSGHDNTTLHLDMDFPTGGVAAQATRAHTEYVLETSRIGMNLNYRQRTANELMSAGIATTETYYHYDAEPDAIYTEPKANETIYLKESEIDSVVVTLARKLQRSLTVNGKSGSYTIYGPTSGKPGTSGATVSDSTVVLALNSMPLDVTAPVTVTVYYHEGVVQSRTINITLSSEADKTVLEKAVNAPLIKGYVVGGGRMASVGSNTVEGGTSITVHNCDSIYAIYGGNDIAGWVHGNASIQIGSDTTGTLYADGTTKRQIHIGYIYGGGCGFYTYEGLHFDAEYAEQKTAYNQGAHGIPYHSYWFSGRVFPYGYQPTEWDGEGNAIYPDALALADGHVFSFTPKSGIDIDHLEDGMGGDGSVPYVYKSDIDVGVHGTNDEELAKHNDYIWIDSVFGGAENSFIGVDATSGDYLNGTTVQIHGGTVYAVFGGNNYGGSVAKKATAIVEVHNTKLTDQSNIENSMMSGYGRDFGVRYVYGGGNLVEHTHSEVNITGGMSDTVFLGGNSANVIEPIGTVNCTGSRFIYENSTIPGFNVADYESDSTAAMIGWVNNMPGEWDEDRGRYNVRVLFGGNNHADMTTISRIYLLSGGIDYVYGGGNQGDMNCDDTLPSEYITPLETAFAGSGMAVPYKVGSLVVSGASSRIIAENIYGGCRMSNVLNSTLLYLRGGTFGYVQGGCDISGDVGSTTGGGCYTILDNSVLVMQDAYGGSDGYYHCLDKYGYYTDEPLHDYNMDEPYDPYDDYVGMKAPTHQNTNLLMKGGTVMSNIYGGAVLTNVGFKNTIDTIFVHGEPTVFTPKTFYGAAAGGYSGSIHLTMTGGTVGLNVYGGGYMSVLHGLGYVHIGGDANVEGSVFAGNDYVGTMESWVPFVKFGVDGKPDSNMVDSRNAALNQEEGSSLNPNFDSYLRIDGTPTLHAVYGGGNGAYNYDGTRPEYDSWDICLDDGDINRPAQKSTYIDLCMEGGYIDTVFGGGNGIGAVEGVTVLLNTKTVDNPDRPDDVYVGTLFGGNNRDDMTGQCVPTVELVQGTVGDVYGGSNAGNMRGSTDMIQDVCGQTVHGVSSYVMVSSANAAIKGSVYGGCNMADVSGMAFIDIRNTRPEGVHAIYGGNNIAGTVRGNTRIDISGGVVDSIYGGSNGHYDYYETTGGFLIYNYGEDTTGKQPIATFATGSPKVASTWVNIYGGTINNSVFGGGRMGDCDSTHVIVNDEMGCGNGNAIIHGTVFGGGEGYWQDLNAPRRGNVLEKCYVDLYHAKEVTSAMAYGGGRGGDVYNTWVTIHDSWDQPFDALYGGCWGSDVIGTAHVTLNGRTDIDGYNVRELFGGNDFTGNVYKSEIVINSGKFYNIYGAGNGNYDTTMYKAEPYNTAATRLYRPNNERVELTFNDGRVDYNIHGGGKYGTTMSYKKDADRQYVLDANGRKIADTNMTYANADLNVDNYAYIVVNVHGGYIQNSVYAGGEGASKGQQLVHGLKVLNMDGGEVRESIYGGSENVDDGYRHECTDTETSKTTQRPSSVLNVTGGTIHSNVFGAGYLGNVYGSTYVNIGQVAIDSCPVWANAYGNTSETLDSTYWLFKPGATRVINGDIVSSHSPALTINDINLNSSVYGGANWGDNAGGARFDVRGYFGGESRVIIDGEGYDNPKPWINIAKNVIGSGTSAEGGDILNRIEIRNYGSNNDNCHSVKKLKSVQRAHQLWLHNTAIEYTGDKDAAFAYQSQDYSLNRIDTINCRGFNRVEVDNVIYNIGEVNFYEDALVNGNLVLVKNEDLFKDATMGSCDNSATICERMNVVDADDPDRRHTVLLVNNGVNVDILKEETVGDNTIMTYGAVNGFAFLMSPNGTNAIVTARWKLPVTNISGLSAETLNNINYYDGGFSSPCDTTNKLQTVVLTPSDTEEPFSWERTEDQADVIAANQASLYEHPYTNYSNMYRVWSDNYGLRRRYATILAHSDPDSLDENKMIKYGEKNLVISKSQLILPPTSPEHYYKLIEGSFVLSGENSNVNLIDSALMPTNWEGLPNNWDSDPTTMYEMLKANIGDGATATGFTALQRNPGTTFGLVMSSGANFKYTDGTPDMPGSNNSASSNTTVTGNTHVNYTENYCSPIVDGLVNTTPIMNLYLTYSNTFSSTFIGTVEFQLDEFIDVWDSVQGKYVEKNLNTPIAVKVIISTIIEEFKDMEYEVLAMCNEGRTNHFHRKAVLPATLQHRELYITKVQWMPTDGDGNEVAYNEASKVKFNLTEDEATVLGQTPEEKHDYFGLSIMPTDDLSSSVSSSIGWHSIDSSRVNLYSVVNTRNTGLATASPISKAKTATESDSVSLRDLSGGKGLKVGELDGRGLAVFDIDLTYDGRRTYDKIGGRGYVGKAIVTMESRVAGQLVDTGGFKMVIYVRTREHGDTIYLASNNTVTRGGRTLTKYDALIDNPTYETGIEGKTPENYVTSFEDALRNGVYSEGDVICILDTVKINNGQVTINGEEYSPIPVIRYDGHHPQFPGESSVYRGPMIIVDGENSYFNAGCIAFDGSAIGKREWDAVNKKLIDDTNTAIAPILTSTNGGHITLSRSTSVMNNYNKYTGTDSKNKGAIALLNDGRLILLGEVSIANNINYHDASIDHPTNGAIYIDGGELILGQSGTSPILTIKDNHIAPTTPGQWWKTYPDGSTGNDVIRWAMDTAITNAWQKANVFLTRTEPATGTDTEKKMYDKQSDFITLASLIHTNTSIGVSKWFPGEDIRDTIRIANQNSGNYSHLESAYSDSIFFSDVDGEDIFYNSHIYHGADAKSQYIYLHRCATFKQQMKDEAFFFTADNGTPINLTGKAPLDYEWDRNATCPTGGDTLYYRLQGGFFPYTYTWTGSTSRTRTTAYQNDVINKQLSADDTNGVFESIVDPMGVPRVMMNYFQTDTTLSWNVEAKDLAGCSQKKAVTVNIKKIDDALTVNNFTKGIEGSGIKAWDNRTVGADSLSAKALREYRAVRITPRVLADSADGIIKARVNIDGFDSIFAINPLNGDQHLLSNLYFCEGDVIQLSTTTKRTDRRFIMWDFDPFYTTRATYIVPAISDSVTAYYGPIGYWKDSISNTTLANVGYSDQYYYVRPDGASYATDYHGNVHIYDERGLAWLISVANGLNGVQARQFYFNNVYLHKKSDGKAYDMQACLWTPMGQRQQPFRGRLIGVGSGNTDTAALTGERVVVKNIIVDEPSMLYTGFFGNLDAARITSIELNSALVRGAQYVGALAAEAVDTKVDNVAVTDNSQNTAATTILSTRYASGGMIGKARNTNVNNSTTKAKYVGDAVYSGGVIGIGQVDTVKNSIARNDIRMSGVYIGGLAGQITDDDAPGSALGRFFSRLFGRKAQDDKSYLANNYIRLTQREQSQYVGGIAGSADNAVIENNYVYGQVNDNSASGAVASELADGAAANGNFAAQGTFAKAVSSLLDDAQMGESATFTGKGNQVKLDHRVNGIDNLTRILNKWVRYQNANGGQFNTWRSDLEGDNEGYPIFGEPDMIPVMVDTTVHGCDVVEWGGQLYNDGDTTVDHVVDLDEMVDSTTHIVFVVHHSSEVNVSDSASADEGYEGHGFSLTAAEVSLLVASAREAGMATITLSDTLTTQYGCDSIVNLTLAFRARQADTSNVDPGNPSDTIVVDTTAAPEISLYPNPTASRVTVDATADMTHVELYDNDGRRMEQYTVGADKRILTIDLSRYPAGIYYVRVYTPKQIDIKKVIKQ